MKKSHCGRISGVNFINVLQVAFTCAYLESVIKTDNLTVFFAHLRSAWEKSAHGMLMKLTPDAMFPRHFFDRILFGTFSLLKHIPLPQLPRTDTSRQRSVTPFTLLAMMRRSLRRTSDAKVSKQKMRSI